jgi:hypothetical protein
MNEKFKQLPMDLVREIFSYIPRRKDKTANLINDVIEFHKIICGLDINTLEDNFAFQFFDIRKNPDNYLGELDPEEIYFMENLDSLD